MISVIITYYNQYEMLKIQLDTWNGYPDEVKRYSDYSSQKAFENWYYFSINKSFKFVDINGFGDYQLESPHFLSVP